MGTATLREGLYRPTLDERGWDDEVSLNFDRIDARFVDRGVNVKSFQFGAKGDGKRVGDGAMTAASAVLTSATAAFVAGDVGKAIYVLGAGAASAGLRTTIASFQSATQVTLTVAASVTVTGARVIWGTDDTVAIQAAMNAIPTAVQDDAEFPSPTLGGSAFFPERSLYVTTASLTMKSFQSLVAASGTAILCCINDSVPAIDIGDNVSAVYQVKILGLSVAGTGPLSRVVGGHGIRARLCYRSEISPWQVWGAADHGIAAEGMSYTHIRPKYIVNCRGRGIDLDQSDGAHFITATTITETTVRLCSLSGIRAKSCSGNSIGGGVTLEANGQVGETVGDEGVTRSMNLLLDAASNNDIDDIYMELGAPVNGTQMAIHAANYNRLRDLRFINFIGLQLHSSVASGTAAFNTVKDCFFPTTVNPNMRTTKGAGAVKPNGNWFVDNIGMNWFDDSSDYAANQVVAHASADGLAARVETATATTTYTPDFGVTTGTGTIADGRRKARIKEVTFTGDVGIQNPTNIAEGEEFTIIVIQDATGGRLITWGTQYKVTSSDAGNTANKRTTFRFVRSGAFHNQVGTQTPYV